MEQSCVAKNKKRRCTGCLREGLQRKAPPRRAWSVKPDRRGAGAETKRERETPDWHAQKKLHYFRIYNSEINMFRLRLRFGKIRR